ncbi:MAG: 2-oxo acid dehydrogenase subunit E2 [Ignavibacteria bacterium]|nr:2-oxo acid dehydrogenase subunit E2 [Ignavibacteria bacterium]
MIIDIIMPKMGESIMEGTILKWLKNVGDKVEKDEALLEISTDKVDTEIPSPESGILVEILYKENEVVEVGKVIARLETEATEKIEIKEEKKKEEKIDLHEEEKIQEPEITSVVVEKGTRFYSPLVLNIAKQEGISISELETIKGSGLEGRVTKKDILEYINQRKQKKEEITLPKEEKVIQEPIVKEPIKIEKPKTVIDYNEEGISVFEFDNIRQKMAEHMVQSVSISPHVNSIAECDLSAVEKIRKKLKDDFEKKEGFKLTYMPFIADAVVKALKDFPLINSVIDNTSIPFKAIIKSRVNLGIAVAMDNGGLIVPVIKEADGKNLVGLARAINDLGRRAKIKKLTLDEIQGGTFTISNYGVFGNIIGTMIINQPQIAILGVGAVKKRPVVLETEDGDFVVIKPMVYLTLSFDHRLIDGALGGKFLMRVVHYLENYTL